MLLGMFSIFGAFFSVVERSIISLYQIDVKFAQLLYLHTTESLNDDRIPSNRVVHALHRIFLYWLKVFGKVMSNQ